MDSNRTVILARVSSKAQEDEGYSLDSQLKLLEGYCDKNNLVVVRVFKIAETASKEQGRKVFHELLEYIEKNNIYHLTVEKTDRLTRNFRDAVAIDEWLDKNEERRLHAVKEDILLHKNAKSDVKFMWNIHVSVAKKYSDNLREEAMKGWMEKLAQGWLPAPPPPGYRTITENGKKIHVPDPMNKAIMQKAFSKFLEPGETISSISEFMSDMGIKTSKGRPYNKSKVHEILLNPFYIGIIRFGGKEYTGAQEKILSKQTFNAVQAKLHSKRPKEYIHHNPVFKGLITCEHCKTVVTWQLQKGRYYGICRQSNDKCKSMKMLREDLVEEEVERQLRKLVCPSRKVINWAIEAIKNDRQDLKLNYERQNEAINQQLNKLQKMDESLYDDKLSGEITKERYEVKHVNFQKQIEDLKRRQLMIGKPNDKLVEYNLALLELSQKAGKIFKKMSPDQKRLILSKLFDSLTLSGTCLSVNYSKLTKLISKNVEESYKIMEVMK